MPRSPLNSVQMPAKQVNGRSSDSANQTTSFFFVSGFGSGTEYDEEHLVTYLRLLDAAKEGADWREVSRIVLHRDPDAEPDKARQAFDSHLARENGSQRLGICRLCEAA